MTQAALVLQTVFQTSVVPRNDMYIACYLPVSHPPYLFTSLCSATVMGFGGGIKTVLNCLERVRCLKRSFTVLKNMHFLIVILCYTCLFSILCYIAPCRNLVSYECSQCLLVCLKVKYIYIPSEYRTYS